MFSVFFEDKVWMFDLFKILFNVIKEISNRY